jgi:LacI family transcriptional regulator
LNFISQIYWRIKISNYNNIRIKLSDIAHKLHYSNTTVSKALRNNNEIHPQTAKLIQNTAEKMGYSPNIIARNLSAKKSNMIGLIVPKIANLFFSNFVESVYDIAFGNDYIIILMISKGDASRERKHLETLLSMNVGGIIISLSQDTEDYKIFEKISNRNIPIVFMNKIPKIESVGIVDLSDFKTTIKSMEQSINLGYRNIVYRNKLEFNKTTGELADFKHIINGEESDYHKIDLNKELNGNLSSDDSTELFLIREYSNLIYTTIQTLAE